MNTFSSNENNDSIYNVENIIKFKYIDFEKITICNYKLLYINKVFYIQSPIFKNFNILNYNNNNYLQLIIDKQKTSHIKFLSFIDTLEIFLKNNNINFKSQIIQDDINLSIKIKIGDENKIFDNSKNEIKILTGKKIILLLNCNINSNFYSIISNQILEL